MPAIAEEDRLTTAETNVDAIFILTTVGFFALAGVYALGCDRL